VVPGSIPRDATYPPPRVEAPHAHAVCRSCGRISEVELRTEEHEVLRALAEQRPVGWAIDGLTFSLTGTCPRCRGLVSELPTE
jgi:Fe2+ or Zn2+ uptake regulation protein